MIKKLICVMVLIVSLSGCAEKTEIVEHNKENNLLVTDNNIENNSNKETKNDELREVILGEWKPISAKSENGEEIGLQLIWGTGIKYGGTLKIYKDGTYTEYIGIIGETAPLEGIWEINSDKIVLTSKTNDKKNLTIIEKDIVDVNYGDYIVRFERHKTPSINKENDIILDGKYTIPNSDSMWAFSKDGKATQSGNIHVDIGTYRTTEENVIEIHYITEKYWNDENGNVEINEIDLYEYITVDDNNVYLMDAEGGKIKLERYGDVTEDDFLII